MILNSYIYMFKNSDSHMVQPYCLTLTITRGDILSSTLVGLFKFWNHLYCLYPYNNAMFEKYILWFHAASSSDDQLDNTNFPANHYFDRCNSPSKNPLVQKPSLKAQLHWIHQVSHIRDLSWRNLLELFCQQKNCILNYSILYPYT